MNLGTDRCCHWVDPNAINLARISLLLLMLGTSLKKSLSHLSVAPSGAPSLYMTVPLRNR